MKVKELKKVLEQYNDDQEVILSKDSEGNSFSPLSCHGGYLYVPVETYYGDIYNNNDAEEAGLDYIENALVLWPIN